MYQPSALVIVGTNQAVLSTGLNQATRNFHQVPLGRACFDDTKVLSASPVSLSGIHYDKQLNDDSIASVTHSLLFGQSKSQQLSYNRKKLATSMPGCMWSL